MSISRYPVSGSGGGPAAATPAGGAQAYVHPGLSLSQVRSIFMAYRRQSAMILFGVVLAAILISMIMPRTYKATATLMVDFNVNDPLGGKDFPTGLMTNYMSTQRDLIMSPAVLAPAIEQAKLADNPEYTAGWRPGKGDVNDWIMDRMQKALKVEVGNYGSQLIYITYSADSAAEAARLANVIAHVYADQQLRRANDPASEQAQRYKAQLDQLKQNVDDAQGKVTDFRQRTGLVEYDSKQDLGGDRLANLEQRLIEAQEQRRAAQAHASTGGGEGDALGSNAVQQLKGTLAQQQAQLAQARLTLGPNHPQIKELESQIAATQGALSSEVSTYSGNASNLYESASKVEHDLQAQVDQERGKLLKTRQLQDEGATYVQALQAAQTLYQRALDGYNQVMMAGNGRYSNVSIVSEATPPVKAAKPKTLLNLVLALAAGSILALLGPFLFELLNRRIRCRDDVERELGVPVLAEIKYPALGSMA